MPGYSGTPLTKKLGIKPSMTLVAVDAPMEYREWLGTLPEGARIVTRSDRALAAVHLFVTERARLHTCLTTFRRTLEPAGFVWVSGPKKASGVATNITEDIVRDVALPMGFVDIKVCAVTDVWSALKLVIRLSERERRQPPARTP